MEKNTLLLPTPLAGLIGLSLFYFSNAGIE
jgi:hypothetical protein